MHADSSWAKKRRFNHKQKKRKGIKHVEIEANPHLFMLRERHLVASHTQPNHNIIIFYRPKCIVVYKGRSSWCRHNNEVYNPNVYFMKKVTRPEYKVKRHSIRIMWKQNIGRSTISSEWYYLNNTLVDSNWLKKDSQIVTFKSNQFGKDRAFKEWTESQYRQ